MIALALAPVVARASPAGAAQAVFAPAVITIGSGPASGAITLVGTPAQSSIVISRAADALGAPVDLGHPSLIARSATDAAGGPALASRPDRLPLGRAMLTSRFGMRTHPLLGLRRAHTGIDLAAPTGTPVFATARGTVTAASWQGGYGLLVAVSHGAGLQTRYAHLSRIAVYPGQSVKAGDLIGHVGSTGRSTGPHLHYELRQNGQALNPLHATHAPQAR